MNFIVFAHFLCNQVRLQPSHFRHQIKRRFLCGDVLYYYSWSQSIKWWLNSSQVYIVFYVCRQSRSEPQLCLSVVRSVVWPSYFLFYNDYEIQYNDYYTEIISPQNRRSEKFSSSRIRISSIQLTYRLHERVKNINCHTESM